MMLNADKKYELKSNFLQELTLFKKLDVKMMTYQTMRLLVHAVRTGMNTKRELMKLL